MLGLQRYFVIICFTLSYTNTPIKKVGLKQILKWIYHFFFCEYVFLFFSWEFYRKLIISSCFKYSSFTAALKAKKDKVWLDWLQMWQDILRMCNTYFFSPSDWSMSLVVQDVYSMPLYLKGKTQGAGSFLQKTERVS